MKILDYLQKYKISQHTFAQAVGVTHQAVAKWLKGSRPRLRMVKKIHKATNGKISLLDVGWPVTHKKKFDRLLNNGNKERLP